MLTQHSTYLQIEFFETRIKAEQDHAIAEHSWRSGKMRQRERLPFVIFSCQSAAKHTFYVQRGEIPRNQFRRSSNWISSTNPLWLATIMSHCESCSAQLSKTTACNKNVDLQLLPHMIVEIGEIFAGKAYLRECHPRAFIASRRQICCCMMCSNSLHYRDTGRVPLPNVFSSCIAPDGAHHLIAHQNHQVSACHLIEGTNCKQILVEAPLNTFIC